MKVKGVMTKGVYTVEEETPLAEVIGIMAYHAISGVGVVDAYGDIVGVVSDTDIVDVLGKGKNVAKIKTGEIMTPITLFVYAGDELEEAVKLMAENKIHRIFVVKEVQAKPRSLSKDTVFHPVGIVSSTDIVRVSGGE